MVISKIENDVFETKGRTITTSGSHIYAGSSAKRKEESNANHDNHGKRFGAVPGAVLSGNVDCMMGDVNWNQLGDADGCCSCTVGGPDGTWCCPNWLSEGMPPMLVKACPAAWRAPSTI
jgi:hypothetical protein